MEPRLAGGRVVTIRTDEETVAAGMREAVSSLPAAGPDSPAATLTIDHRRVGERDRYRVHAGGSRIGWVDDPERAVGYALAGLNRLAADGTPGRLLMHAGVVERDGRVALLAGNSGRGKSTLTAALVRHGLSYLSDELAIVDPGTAEVTPYPKALELDDAAAELLGLPARTNGASGERHIPPAELGAVSGGGELALIVLLEGPATGGDGPFPLAPAEAMLRMLSDVLPQTWQVPGALDALADLCERVPAVLLPRLDLADAVEVVTAGLASS